MDANQYPAYVQQTARAYRFLDRYKVARTSMQTITDGSSWNAIEDNLWAFFQNCWHIKDWIRNDPSIDENAKTPLLASAHADPDILAARDLANGSKHFGLSEKKNRVEADQSSIHIRDLSEGAVEVDHVIDLSDGTKITAIELGERAMAAWQRLFAAAGMSYFRVESH